MSCCESCSLGKACESACDIAGQDPLPGGILQAIGGAVTPVGVLQQNPPMSGLIPPQAIITPSQIPKYLLASVPLTGLPGDIPAASTKPSLAIPPQAAFLSIPIVQATIASWKASPQGKSAGWQDKSADFYWGWLEKAVRDKDPTALQLREWLMFVSQEAGNPAWLTGQLATLGVPPVKGQMGGAPSGGMVTPHSVARKRVRVVGLIDPVAMGYQ